jgi:chromosome segregation ATPase
VVIALAIATIYMFLQLNKVQTNLAALRESMATEVTGLKQASTVTSAANRRHLETLRDELETARRQAAMAAGSARGEAQKHADELARRLEVETKRQQQVLRTEIGEVKETATATSAKVGEVTTEVGTVKTEVAANKAELDKTTSDLKRATGDLGVQSGLIATNSKELSALKALGERNYFEFNLVKSKKPQRVGDITILLKKADLKKNLYTIELVADDKKVEKKDKNINEPLQFYVSKAPRQPYEIVVNEVKKDRIAGYLSTPKVQQAR